MSASEAREQGACEEFSCSSAAKPLNISHAKLRIDTEIRTAHATHKSVSKIVTQPTFSKASFCRNGNPANADRRSLPAGKERATTVVPMEHADMTMLFIDTERNFMFARSPLFAKRVQAGSKKPAKKHALRAAGKALQPEWDSCKISESDEQARDCSQQACSPFKGPEPR